MVEQVIDIDGIKRGEYFIKPSFDKELEELKEEMDAVIEKLNKEHVKAAKDLKLDMGTTLKLDCIEKHGYHFRITLSNESVLRNNKKYKQLETVKAGVRFNTANVEELNLEFDTARKSYEEQQKTIVDEVIRVARKRFIGKFFFFEISLNFDNNFSWLPW